MKTLNNSRVKLKVLHNETVAKKVIETIINFGLESFSEPNFEITEEVFQHEFVGIQIFFLIDAQKSKVFQQYKKL